MADDVHGRAVKYVVLPVESVRMLNIRSDSEVIEAQKTITDDMMKALEDMVSSARANKLEGQNALTMAAIKW